MPFPCIISLWKAILDFRKEFWFLFIRQGTGSEIARDHQLAAVRSRMWICCSDVKVVMSLSATGISTSHLNIFFSDVLLERSEEGTNKGFATYGPSVPTLTLSPTKPTTFMSLWAWYLLWNHRSLEASQVYSPCLHILMPEGSFHTGPAASRIWLLH